MPNIQVKLRRGTTAQHAGFTGAEGEVTVDTDKETLVVHDNATAGGHELLKGDNSNLSVQSGTVVVNDALGDVDFIVKSTGNGNLIITDGANNAVGIGTTTNANFALTASNAAVGSSLVIYDPTSSIEGGQININKAGINTPSNTESDGFIIDAYDTGPSGNYGLPADTDVLRIIGTPGVGPAEKSIIITEDADLSTTGKVGIGKFNSGACQLEVDGDILVNDTGDNFPAAIFAGSAGTAIQLNDQSTNGQVYNVSSNPDSAGRGGFGIGHIAQAGTPLTITHVSSTATLATFSTSSAHGLTEGQYGALSGGDASWAGFVEIVDVPSATTFVVPKVSVSTNYPTTLTPNDTVSTIIVRRHEESSVLYNMIKILGLPKDIDDGGVAGTQPSWLEPGQLWIDTTDNSIKINPEVTT